MAYVVKAAGSEITEDQIIQFVASQVSPRLALQIVLVKAISCWPSKLSHIGFASSLSS